MASLKELLTGVNSNPAPAISTIDSLKQQIIKANNAYRTGNPIISDEEYDILLSKLDSQMGFIEFDDFLMTLTEEKGIIKLDYVLGSLTKLKYEEPENLYKWISKNKISRLFASLKIDGCSFNASYRDGLLVMCSSRGDGETGTDWTEKSKYILPTVISYKADLDIRGEFTLTDDSHFILGGKNRRNSTVGIMNEKLIVPEKLKYVKGICYEVLSGTMKIEEQFNMLKEIGFTTPAFIIFPEVTRNIHEALKSYYTDMKSYLALQDYDVDGLVISSPSYKTENVFFPEAKVAFKINSEGVNAEVLGVEWNVSKGGLLKPVVLIVPTTINGTTIGRVTGINAQYISENQIGEGAIVSIIRSGEVIPKIINIIKGGACNDLPTTCPSCNMRLQWKSVDLVCNNIHCGDKLVKEVASFLINNGVENVTAKSLANWNIVNYNDLLCFDPDTNSKSQDKFATSLTKNIFSKTKEELFSQMSFDGAGSTNINKLIEFYGNGDLELATRNLYINECQDGYPEGIGDKIIDKIEADWKKNISVLNCIMKDRRYAPVAKVVSAPSTGNLSGKSFLLTGSMSETRGNIEKLIKENGGTIASSVSKALSFLVCAPDSWGSSSKYTKAVKSGVQVITEDQLRGMI